MPKELVNNQLTWDNGLTEQQNMAVGYITAIDNAGFEWGDVADRLGINRKTLFRWRQLPEFQQALLKAQKAEFDAFRTEADKRLLDIIKDPNTAIKDVLEALKLWYKVNGAYTPDITTAVQNNIGAISISIQSAPAKSKESETYTIPVFDTE